MLLSFFQIYCYAVNGFSIFCNGILLILSSHKIEAIQELRYFLSNISVAGIVLSLCVLLVQPQMVTRGPMCIRVPHGPLSILNADFVKLTSSIAVVFYMYGMLSFPLFFVYRTMILVNSTALGQYFNKRNLLITFGVVFIFCSMEGACLYYSNIPYEDLFERLNKTSKVMQDFDAQYKIPEQLLHHQPQSTDTAQTTPATHHNVSGVILVAEDYRKHLALTGEDYTKNPLILYFYGIAVVSHAISYIVILISAHFMMNTLKEKQGTMSLDTFVANEALVHAVFADAFLPLVFALPLAANAMLSTFYENSLVWQEFFPAYCISLVPLLSPMISIFFIKAYKDLMLSFVTFRFLRKDKKKAEEDRKAREEAN
ncbi:unnamed protein product [Cylicocyclus nassatus]|uniref:Uncharacterized protein n=1 Tax=Cylicocyclus nassatus TaxID=53992 RepID=A0AA36GFP8_CYLNA|nr:unnamed protein product [Cylicocyclus nassatus]